MLKKYPSLKAELLQLSEQIAENPGMGIALGKNCFKIRLAIKSKGKGKSGGARVITYVIANDQEVALLSIYDKSTKNDLEPGEIDLLLSDL